MSLFLPFSSQYLYNERSCDIHANSHSLHCTDTLINPIWWNINTQWALIEITHFNATIYHIYTNYRIAQNFDEGKYCRIWCSASNPSKFSLSILSDCRANTGCLRDYPLTFSRHKLLNEANLSIISSIKILCYTVVLKWMAISVDHLNNW